MKKNTLKLEKLIVKSFMTEINPSIKKTLKGGDDNIDNPENSANATQIYTNCNENTCLCAYLSGGEQNSVCCGTPYTNVVGRGGGGGGSQ